jgi:hypothetical protein
MAKFKELFRKRREGPVLHAAPKAESERKGNPSDKPKSREVEFSKNEVLREEVKIY